MSSEIEVTDIKKVNSMLGIATKAGKSVSGEFSTEKAVKEGSAKLVFVACDASDNTKKMFSDMCSFYKVPFYVYGSKECLGHYTGKQYRASLAVNDEGMAKTLIKYMTDAHSNDNGGSVNG